MKFKGYFFNIIFYIVVFSIVGAFIFIYYFNNKIGTSLIECAEDEVRHLVILVMNNSVYKYIDSIDNLSIINVEKNRDGSLGMVSYDVKMLNGIRRDVIEILEGDLELLTGGRIDEVGINLNKISDTTYEMRDDGILFMVSMGSVTGNKFLANIGPKIPLNLKLNGDVISEIDTDVSEYGINNALIRVSINMKVVMIINMPFLSSELTIDSSVPLSMEIIQGDVMGYYFNGNNNS